MKKIIILCCLFLASIAMANPIAVIAPMTSESTYLKTQMQNLKNHDQHGMHYFTGKVDGHDVVLINSGVGKVSAAVTTTWLHFFVNPKLIILMGSAGAVDPNLKIGAVVVGNRVFDADYGQLTNHGPVFPVKILDPNKNEVPPTYFHPGKQYYPVLTDILKKLHQKYPNSQFQFGTIATSDAYPNTPHQNKVFHENNVAVIAMEDASVDKVCWLYDMSCVNIRSISNASGVKQTKEGTAIAQKNASLVAIDLIKKIK